MPPIYPVEASEWSLDYKRCTLAELRKFIEDRRGATLGEKEAQKVGNRNKWQLTRRLHRMDLESTFPRFMELPPELRLSMYESLLIDTRERDEDGEASWNYARNRYKLHLAVLRTSKQVYLEAEPILDEQNMFGARISYQQEGSRHTGPVVGCSLTVIKPGSRFPFYQSIPSIGRSRSEPLLQNLFCKSTMGMLRMLTRLTIDLSLVTPGEDESYLYVRKACDAIASLCLSLTGLSKMEELTINIDPGDPQRSNVDLGRVLWPLMFLYTDIVVKFKGMPPIPETFMTRLTMQPWAEVSLGRQIARVRKRCNEEITKNGWDLDGLRDVEVALDDLSHFGDWFISFDDIVNLSGIWRGIRSQADVVEASRLEQ